VRRVSTGKRGPVQLMGPNPLVHTFPIGGEERSGQGPASLMASSAVRELKVRSPTRGERWPWSRAMPITKQVHEPGIQEPAHQIRRTAE
jgi:hypothetical protein